MKRLSIGCLIMLIVGVVVAVLAAGQQQRGRTQPTPISVAAIPTDTPEPGEVIGRVGKRQEAGGIAVTVLGVQKLDQIGDMWKPDEGNIYLVIETVIENVSRDEAPYNPLYFKVKDADGFEYNTSIVAPDPGLKSGTLARGERARGFVSFEVKRSARGLVATYEPVVLLGGYKPIRIDLGE